MCEKVEQLTIVSIDNDSYSQAGDLGIHNGSLCRIKPVGNGLETFEVGGLRLFLVGIAFAAMHPKVEASVVDYFHPRINAHER